MIRLQNLTLPPEGTERQLRQKAAKLLGVSPDSFTAFSLSRQSIDARKKPAVRLVCTVELSHPAESSLRLPRGAERFTPQPYVFPAVRRRSTLRPVVAGMGPAGLFAALYLARNGVPCVVLERGRPVEERTADVERFWRTGELSPVSNVQFGEGGAGTFSDGKLTTGTHDRRIRTVLETLAAAGAPEDILYQQKPHVGTDILRTVVKNIRLELLRLGCEVRFETQLTALRTGNGRLTGITAACGQGAAEGLDCDTLILAPGHSARDTFRMLFDAGVPLEPKPFAVGVRVEHPQALVSQAQYGSSWEKLPPADYKLACHLPSGRSAFTFCVCPGGQVVAAASGYGQVVTNGMSLRARDGGNCNGGLLVGATPADFGGSHPLAGVDFQERWERAAWDLGSGNAPPAFDAGLPLFRAPAQTVGDFLSGRPSTGPGSVLPTYRPGVTWTDLHRCLPSFVADTLRDALPLLDRKLHGFAAPETVLTGVETRSSSPVRILRGEDLQSVGLSGLYPCGEGAGYAGGITSAAVDGIRVAEAVARDIP